MKRALLVMASLAISSQAYAVADMVLADTQTVTGQKIFTSTRSIVVSPNGFVDVQVGKNADSSSGALLYDLSKSTSPGIVIFNNAAQDVNSGNSFLTLISTGTSYGGYFIRIFRNDTNSNGEIRVDGPAPNYEEVETDQVAPAGKWEHGTSNDTWYVAARNAADNSFERVFTVTAKRSSSGAALVLLSTGTLKFEDSSGSQIGFKAPTSLSASWTHDLWSTFANMNKMLAQPSNNAPRALQWVDTFVSSAPLSLIQSTTPSRVGTEFYCTDCTTSLTCISTGTVKGAFSSMQGANRTTSCQ